MSAAIAPPPPAKIAQAARDRHVYDRYVEQMHSRPAALRQFERAVETFAGPDGAPRLSEHQRAVLTFAQRAFRTKAERKAAIYQIFRVPPGRFAQWLDALANNPAAANAEPRLVHELRRARTARLLADPRLPQSTPPRTTNPRSPR